MMRYTRKLGPASPAELSAAWCARFVPKPTLKEVVDGALGIGTDAIGYNASFLYPKEGGIESLARAILKDLRGGEVTVNTEPTAIDWKQKTVALSNGEVLRYSHLISTIALPALIHRCASNGSK